MKNDDHGSLIIHDPTTLEMLKSMSLGYLKSLEAAVRLMVALFIVGLLYFILRTCSQAIMMLILGERVAGQFTPWILLPFLPPIIRAGLRSGGLLIPPLFKLRSESHP